MIILFLLLLCDIFSSSHDLNTILINSVSVMYFMNDLILVNYFFIVVVILDNDDNPPMFLMLLLPLIIFIALKLPAEVIVALLFIFS